MQQTTVLCSGALYSAALSLSRCPLSSSICLSFSLSPISIDLPVLCVPSSAPGVAFSVSPWMSGSPVSHVMVEVKEVGLSPA